MDLVKDELFFSKIKKTKFCWIWTGSKNKDGYGQLTRLKKLFLSHRYSYLIHIGNIPNGKHVLHKCDTPSCVNPDHLFLGTHQENMDDMVKKGRAHKRFSTHCKSGHPLDKENTFLSMHGKYLNRRCLICKRKYENENYYKRKRGSK